MKFAIAKEHRDFFQNQGMIEFENFLNTNQLQALNQAIDQALVTRAKISQQKLRQLSSEQLFLNGRDLWRSSEELRQLTCQPRLASIASELIDKKPLRLAYDQLIPARHQSSSPSSENSVYGQFLGQFTTLEEMSCMTGILCGLMVCLSTDEEPKEISSQQPTIFPRQAGNVIFFQPSHHFNLEDLYQHPYQRFYLIVYSQAIAHYQLQLKDPHTHALKHLGYVFNDKLSDKLNPIVYR